MSRAAELFADLLDATPAEVEARLAAEPPALAAEVRALLAHDQAASGFLAGPVLARPEPPRAPRTIGRFTVRRRLGEGGMGVVYAAHDPQLDREVAIKVVGGGLFDTSGRSRLLREARYAARLSHPHIVPIYEAGEHEGDVYVVMELVPGAHPRATLAAEPRRSWQERLALMLQAGRGLAAVHRAGMVHRDMKPENVLVGADGRARVADFGLAVLEATSPTGQVIDGAGVASHSLAHAGTPLYMSPEQWNGIPGDAKSDQFAFAVMALEALGGAHPFPASSIPELALKVTSGRFERVRPPEVPPELVAVLERALSPEPAARWRDLDELLAELEHVSGPGFEQDLSVGRRTRWVASAFLLALPFVAYPVARARFASDPPAAVELLHIGAALMLPVYLALPFAWRVLRRNAVNRATFRALWVGPTAMLTSRVVSTFADLPVGQVLAHDLVALSAVFVLAASTIHRAFFVPAAVLAGAALFAAAHPAWALEAFASAAFSGALTTVVVWTRARRT